MKLVTETAFGYVSTEDWCDQLSKPYVPKTGNNAIVDSVEVNQQILAELKSQNNQTAATFKAIVSELQSQKNASAATLKEIVSELQCIRTAMYQKRNANLLMLCIKK